MLTYGPTRVDAEALSAVGPNGPTTLTALEARVVHFLSRHAGDTVSRERLERDVWQFRPGVRSEAVPVGMRRLRKKLGPMIETVRGKGWRLNLDPVGPRP